MKAMIFSALLISLTAMTASANVKFTFNNEELGKMIEIYSNATGQKFVIDPGVRGKATILKADDVSTDEAFNLLSSALAINGYAVIKEGDTMIIKNARNAQRDGIEVSNTLPAMKPERMATYIYTLKNIPATQANQELRIFPSKDGEMIVNSHGNQLIISDFTSNLQRIDKMLKEIDVPANPKFAKANEENTRKWMDHARGLRPSKPTEDTVVPEKMQK